MIITLRCSHCSTELSFNDLLQNDSPCPVCDQTISLFITESMRHDNIVDHCAICGLGKLYTQKDFNRTLGISIFLGAAIISLIFYGYNYVVTAFLVLGGAVAADYLLYMALPEVTICYRCHSQYRNVTNNPVNKIFDLALAEKYDPLNKQKEAENPAAHWRQR